MRWRKRCVMPSCAARRLARSDIPATKRPNTLPRSSGPSDGGPASRPERNSTHFASSTRLANLVWLGALAAGPTNSLDGLAGDLDTVFSSRRSRGGAIAHGLDVVDEVLVVDPILLH